MYYKLIVEERCKLDNVYCEKIRYQKDNVIFEKCFGINKYFQIEFIYGEKVCVDKEYRYEIAEKIILNKECFLGKAEIDKDIPVLTCQDCYDEYKKIRDDITIRARKEIINNLKQENTDHSKQKLQWISEISSVDGSIHEGYKWVDKEK
jgi:hypothetical protein